MAPLAALVLALACGVSPAAAARRHEAHHAVRKGGSGHPAAEHVNLSVAAAADAAAPPNSSTAGAEPKHPAARSGTIMTSLLSLAAAGAEADGAAELTMADRLRQGYEREAERRKVQPFVSFASLFSAPKAAPQTLPEQGYHGEEVSHANMKTSTGDWTTEYGPTQAPTLAPKSGSRGRGVAAAAPAAVLLAVAFSLLG
eukprot:CAMPEP_0204564392 /NCGR_PEP_ID=MMETSP0661-20131031/34862_1 /ASSEMBLY_ACC=CAM_ASM_000606 /TAXON_ID=109239 /ORGANISM="Alexandrium margalefi, Strain AMGDE01CS-322" /LENGTH=198 /DNA_ID=CAMNT_0051572031 /DNA_START=53 /DNA_END=649 /DNA_ORIENTATION=+